MADSSDLLTEYEEQIFSLQSANKDLSQRLIISESTTRDLKAKNELIQNQISDVEDKYIQMREEYTRTINTLKSKISGTAEAADDGQNIIDDHNKIDMRQKENQHSFDEIENIYLSIERLLEANNRLVEENANLNGFLRNKYVRQSISNLKVDQNVLKDPKKESLFDNIKMFLSNK